MASLVLFFHVFWWGRRGGRVCLCIFDVFFVFYRVFLVVLAGLCFSRVSLLEGFFGVFQSF